ncbi:MAG: hypothetical protein U9N42_00855 [Campylobacterota bacterium]|nr:hypothetical protein [Campylobacterota bacterium]
MMGCEESEYYKLFSENKFVHNSYEHEINITKDGYDAFIYSATKLTVSQVDSFSFNTYNIDELLKHFCKKVTSLKSLSLKTYTNEEMIDDCIEYEHNKIDTKLFYKDF